MDDTLDVWPGGVDRGVQHESGLVHPEVGRPFLNSLALERDNCSTNTGVIICSPVDYLQAQIQCTMLYQRNTAHLN